MKFIIIGLGNFGAWLAQSLTSAGHDVIGIDTNMIRVEALKDKITHVVKIDSTDITALKTLPLKDASAVVVCIGEDVGASIQTTALLKQLKIKRIICRVISPLHETVITAIGVDEVVHPEQDAAEQLSKKLDLVQIIESFEISNNYYVVEVKATLKFNEISIGDSKIFENYDLQVITLLRPESKESIFGFEKTVKNSIGLVDNSTIILTDDIIVIYGHIKNIRRLVNDLS
ncbi:MAG: TrkA family potassium uptake protein [Bacteroidetes bacterium]|nr:TrkA family potassium uptake protein [Bacteroidota bacterium]MBP7399789.1 TrkA family potassium uptake protein [Chitinophagales bacterium]MBK7110108.1 TrkA family potassium uptake protein [Bacteroidota bacterium]MBK8487166.1 TrkA family potassium uptake protein [Bacteroidota bacterium]MBK8680552.1 TrkA family potassium uptake protein [Bacteroidota bacterium]